MKNQNECEGCTACCRTHSVLAIGKQVGQDCPHCDWNVGCRLYENCPDDCHRYVCMWLRLKQDGRYVEELRPDVCGFVLNIYPEQCQLWEVESGSLEQEKTIKTSLIMANQNQRVLHFYLDGRIMEFHPDGTKTERPRTH